MLSGGLLPTVTPSHYVAPFPNTNWHCCSSDTKLVRIALACSLPAALCRALTLIPHAASITMSSACVSSRATAGLRRQPAAAGSGRPARVASAPRSSRQSRKNTTAAAARLGRSAGFSRVAGVRRVALAAEGSGDGETADPDAVAPEDYALVVELLDSENGEELKSKVDLVAENGLLTKGVVDAARVVVEQNEQAGQEEDILDLLRSVYNVLLNKFKELYAPGAKAALEFGSVLMDQFSAEDLELMEAGEVPVSIGKVKLMMQEEFDKEEGDRVDKMEFAKYLDEVLPVMSLQDDRLKEKMEQAPDDATAQRLVGVMMNRTKERLKVEALRDIARDL
jgi:hypothetical protein